ncbi:hypothetical protein [Marinovum sp.]|uniref:hypothetical protein n=1 Tax=Marinovum sp. TaxID=2024839 RepID=UPI002B273F51|nr:hypothetical protein [Marinovum sp.]
MKRRKNLAYPWFIAALPALILAAALPVSATTERVRAVPAVQGQAVPGQAVPVWGIAPPVLYLMPRRKQPFLEERIALMQALTRAEDNPPARYRVLLELAEFHFAHGMITEALSILTGVHGAQVPPAHGLRAAALELALGLFDPLQRPLTERAAALLSPGYADWPDQPMLLALSQLRADDCASAAPGLRAAFDRLQRFPDTAREEALPLMLECAIDDRQWRLARDIATRFADHASLDDGPALHFLLGKVAEVGDEPLAAFDSYALAQGASNLWGHRARRAIVELGLKHEALSSAEAADLLALETEVWRGDALAAETLADLAALQEISGDAVAAAETYGKLRQRHAGSREATLARGKAQKLIDRLYVEGAEGEITLSTFMDLHARIAPWFRFTEGYAASAEHFADHFFAVGATTIAAQEYAAIRDHLTAAQDLGLFSPEPGALDRLAVKEAEALLAGGQFETLGLLLAAAATPDDPELAERLALVSAQHLEETGQRAALLSDTDGGAPEQVLRLRAQARFERGEWPEAQAAYAALAQRSGPDLPLPDAIRYLLAAHRSGDSLTAGELVQRFDGLTDLPQWTEIAATLTRVPPDLLPLRQDAARSRINSAQEMLDTLSAPRGVN